MNAVTSLALRVSIPIIVGVLAHYGTQLLKQLSTWIDAAPSAAKQAVVVTLSLLFVLLAHYVGDALPGVCVLSDSASDCLRALTDDGALRTLLGALIAVAMHAGKKQTDVSAAAAAGSPAQEG